MAETAPPDAEQLISDYDDLWSGDLSKLDMVSESISFYYPLGEAHGKDAVEEEIREMKTGFPDVTIQTDEMLAGDDIIMHELTWTGTHEGEFNDISPTGREVEVKAMVKLVLEDGKIKEDRTYFDSQDVLAQLGVTE
jgi:steroid delta-isomerase-like uncharacterized protein